MKSQAQTDHLTLIDGLGKRRQDAPLENIDELSRRIRQLLLYDRVEFSKVQPFFWSLAEAYYDRFEVYPFDVPKALFSYLELHDYPEAEVRGLVQQLEKRFLEQHGRPLKPTTGQEGESDSVESEIKELRDSLKYASLLDEV